MVENPAPGYEAGLVAVYKNRDRSIVLDLPDVLLQFIDRAYPALIEFGAAGYTVNFNVIEDPPQDACDVATSDGIPSSPGAFPSAEFPIAITISAAVMCLAMSPFRLVSRRAVSGSRAHSMSRSWDSSS
ncbi:hypothetical protein K466DRAFT_263591 [Polyporus arcularius HHB13444]|uniref:Uncharacterized protein n=1 Tax=Polyporus arcularius HHB13444 TaxID=1314778 RepID=A0A5C3PC38_9APHY|nr:hypothetical protein K466DRAFT_263591 [Polyporus arcularius HHB13444]